jgi:hypothetical protein
MKTAMMAMTTVWAKRMYVESEYFIVSVDLLVVNGVGSIGLK